MDDIVRSTLIRVLASLTDAEFTDVVEAARGDDYTPSRRDYDAVVAELQAQEQPQRRAAIAEQIRSLVQKGG